MMRAFLSLARRRRTSPSLGGWSTHPLASDEFLSLHEASPTLSPRVCTPFLHGTSVRSIFRSFSFGFAADSADVRRRDSRFWILSGGGLSRPDRARLKAALLCLGSGLRPPWRRSVLRLWSTMVRGSVGERWCWVPTTSRMGGLRRLSGTPVGVRRRWVLTKWVGTTFGLARVVWTSVFRPSHVWARIWDPGGVHILDD